MGKPSDYRKWSAKALDDAIMYICENGGDLQKLDRLLAARNYREHKGV